MCLADLIRLMNEPLINIKCKVVFISRSPICVISTKAYLRLIYLMTLKDKYILSSQIGIDPMWIIMLLNT